jgi:hypothetical protein
MAFNDRGHHFIRVTNVVYPLTPSNGYAADHTIQVYGPLGYSVDLKATVVSYHGARNDAGVIAAALSQCPVDEIETDNRYYYRTDRRASTPSGDYGVRFTPSCQISRRQYEALLNHTADHTDILLEIERALASPSVRITTEAIDEQQAPAE